jgi:alcohol dehydrogenase
MSKLIKFLQKNNSKKIFLVTGRKSYSLSGFSEEIGLLEKDFNFTRFYNFETNPKIEDVKKGVTLYKKNNCDLIISVGGGSVLDMGKLISSFIDENLLQKSEVISVMNSFERKCPLLLIPTTAGSGSEETTFAVLYINNIKYSVNNESLYPDELILNPKYSYSMNANQKAISGLDAFTQCIESYWSKNATKDSRKHSIDGLKLIWENLHQSVLNNDYDSHKKVVIGSNLAGKAINVAKTTAPHAISYYFTVKHNIKHGHAVCLFFSKIYNYNFSNVDKKDMDLVKMFNTLNSILGISKYNAIEIIDQFISKLNIELDFNNLGIDLSSERLAIISSINKERLRNNPCSIDLNYIL